VSNETRMGLSWIGENGLGGTSVVLVLRISAMGGIGGTSKSIISRGV